MIRRNLLPFAEESMRLFRVTVINGPRQAGKTTLLREMVRHRGSYWSLDDGPVRASAHLDPAAFVEQGALPMAIDEVQRGGNNLLLAIKSVVDVRPHRGQFVVAGSTRFLSVPQLSESLAGRAEVLDLWPFSQGELAGVKETFIDTLMSEPANLAKSRCEQVDRRDLLERVVRGGFPEVVDAASSAAARWYRSYVRTVVERDITEASAISQASELPTLLRLLAANTSGELVTSRIAGDARMSADTVARYIGLLELVGLVTRVRAWTPSLTSREKRHPKMVVTDSGLACALLGRDLDGLTSIQNPLTGPLLESFVTMELLKQCGWSKRSVTVRHWRDRNGAEVDLILESDDGVIAGIEVKSAASVWPTDAKHLAGLRDNLGQRFAGGVVLYLGERILPLGDRLWAMPLSVLWSD